MSGLFPRSFHSSTDTSPQVQFTSIYALTCRCPWSQEHGVVKIETVGKTFMFAGLGEEGCKEAALQVQAVKRPGFF